MGYSQVDSALLNDDPALATRLLATWADADAPKAEFLRGLLIDLGISGRMDPKLAMTLLVKAANKADPEAQLYLAYKYETGFGLDKADPKAAASWKARAKAVPALGPGLGHWLSEKDGVLCPNLLRAFFYISNEAADGNVVAEANLADVYLSPAWGRADVGLHLMWLTKAAEGRDPQSMETLATYYSLGILVDKDPARAFSLREAAAQAGLETAQAEIGRQYEDGDGVTADAAAAAKWYRLAAAQGDVDSANRLTSLLLDGADGVAKDVNEARHLAEAGASKGDADALTNLAEIYANGAGVPKDYQHAITLYEEASAKGSVKAMYALGDLYSDAHSSLCDYSKARDWYKKAASNGYEYAMNQIGLLYEEGKGVPKDESKAFEWIEQAARAGNGWAQNHLGWMLREGIGIEKDDAEAVGWFKLALKHGQPIAGANLGYHYANGLGVQRDRLQAFKYLQAALREMDDPWVNETAVRLFGSLTPEETKQLRPAFIACLEDPTVVDAKGPLPEICLNVTNRFRGKDTDQAVSLLMSRLANSSRVRAYGDLAWRSFMGQDISYNPTKAREWAKQYAAHDPKRSRYMLAVFDSYIGDSETVRDKAVEDLKKMADEGYQPAIYWLACRSCDGLGIPSDESAALHYYNLSVGALPKYHAATFATVAKNLEDVGRDAPPKPPSENVIDEAIKRNLKNKADARPAVVYEPKPIICYDLAPTLGHGKAFITFTVNPEGRPGNIKIESATQPIIGLIGVQTVRNMRFIPACKEGKPIADNMAVPIVY